MSAEIPSGSASRAELERLLAELKRLSGEVTAAMVEVVEPDLSMLVQRAEAFASAIRARDEVFSPEASGLFGDPIFAILLDLFIRGHRNLNTGVTASGIASGVPVTTALRRVALLEEFGLVVKRQDHLDRRRQFLELSQKGEERMRSALSRMSVRP